MESSTQCTSTKKKTEKVAYLRVKNVRNINSNTKKKIPGEHKNVWTRKNREKNSIAAFEQINIKLFSNYTFC